MGVGVALGVPLGVQRGVALGVIRGVPWGVGKGVRRGVPIGVFDQDMSGVMESSMGQLHSSTISSLSFCSASGGNNKHRFNFHKKKQDNLQSTNKVAEKLAAPSEFVTEQQ